MLGKALLSLLLVLGAASAASADDPPTGPPAIPQGEEGTWYGEQLALRTNPAAHVDELLARFGSLDGQVLIEQTIGEDYWLIFWSTALGHVQIAKNGEFVAMTPSYDLYGRAAFECAGLTGWVDVADEYTQGEISPVGQPPQRYVGLCPEPGAPLGVPGSPLFGKPTGTKECVCKGTVKVDKELCDGEGGDCTDAQPCEYINAAGGKVKSKCIWSAVPVKKEVPAPPREPAPPGPESTPPLPQADSSDSTTCASGSDVASLGIAAGLTAAAVPGRIKKRRGRKPKQ